MDELTVERLRHSSEIRARGFELLRDFVPFHDAAALGCVLERLAQCVRAPMAAVLGLLERGVSRGAHG
jgi:hypothetical protein